MVSTVNAEWPAFEVLTSAAAFSVKPFADLQEVGMNMD